jgi:hypothetical protein
MPRLSNVRTLGRRRTGQIFPFARRIPARRTPAPGIRARTVAVSAFEGGTVNRKHALIVAVALGIAALVAAFAVVRTTASAADARDGGTPEIAARARALDRFEASLRRELARQPAQGQPPAAAPGEAQPERVVYVRPPAGGVQAAAGDDDRFEDEGHDDRGDEHEYEGGDDDD